MISYKVIIQGEPCEIQFPDVQYPIKEDSTKEEIAEFTDRMNSYLERMYQIKCDKDKVIEPEREKTRKVQEETQKVKEETQKVKEETQKVKEETQKVKEETIQKKEETIQKKEETKQESAKAAKSAFDAFKAYAPIFGAFISGGIIGGATIYNNIKNKPSEEDPFKSE